MDPIQPSSSKKSAGSVVAIVIVVVLIILAALYFWGGKSIAGIPANSQASTVSQSSKSDDVDSIEADLKATDPGPDLSGLN